jgi:hypothetical protein
MSSKEEEILLNDDKFLEWLIDIEKENQKFMMKCHRKRKKGNKKKTRKKS